MLNEYKTNFLLAYDNELFDQTKEEEYENLKKVWKKAKKNPDSNTINIDDLKDGIFSRYKAATDDKKKIFDAILENLYTSGHKLLDYYYGNLFKEEQFNNNINDLIEEIKDKYVQKIDEQILNYKITPEELNEIKSNYEKNSINDEKRNEFIQIINSFVYILFDLLLNRIFINQKFTYSDIVNEIIDIYFGIFNLLFYKADKIKINQYKKLLENYLSQYLFEEKDGIYKKKRL